MALAPIIFTVPGPVRGKSRPRVSTRGKFVRVHPTDDDLSYEGLVKVEGAKAMNGVPPFAGPCELRLTIRRVPAASTSRPKRAAMLAGDIRPTQKPDVDNVAKIIADALNKIAWNDDAQVCDLTVRRIYAEIEGVEVFIRQIGGAA